MENNKHSGRHKNEAKNQMIYKLSCIFFFHLAFFYLKVVLKSQIQMIAVCLHFIIISSHGLVMPLSTRLFFCCHLFTIKISLQMIIASFFFLSLLLHKSVCFFFCIYNQIFRLHYLVTDDEFIMMCAYLFAFTLRIFTFFLAIHSHKKCI